MRQLAKVRTAQILVAALKILFGTGPLGSNQARKAARGIAEMAHGIGRGGARPDSWIQRLGRSRVGGSATPAADGWQAYARLKIATSLPSRARAS